MKYIKEYWDDVAKALTSIPNVEKLYGKSIFVTGATGMICSSIVDILLYLNKNCDANITIIAAGRNEERMYKRFEGFTAKEGLIFSAYDATSVEAIGLENEIDFIIHGASNANPQIYMQEPVDTMMANILGLKVMLELAERKKADRLLYVSSSEVYGKKEHSEKPYAEEDYGYLDILNKRASYPSAKRAGETLCVAFGMQYGVDTVMVRPGHIYGPSITRSDSRASAEFSRRAAEGLDIIMKSEGTQLRSYCYTLDCASAMLTVLTEGKNGNAYNISNPNSICSIRDIATEISVAAGVNLVFDIPTEAEKGSYNLMDNSSLKSDKLEALGWIPKFSLEDGVRNMMKVLKA